MKVTIVGLGLIGGSLALELKASGFADSITGVDQNPDHVREALKLALVDRVDSLEKALLEADFVVLAIPVDAIARLLPRSLSSLRDGATLTDMGSTKEQICGSVADHSRREQFVASHPMAGTEFSGPQAAFKGLFAGKAAVICESEKSGKEHLNQVERMYALLRMRLIRMGSAEHDLHAAYVSHLSHISSFVLANAVLTKEKNANTIFDLASGGFESTVRLAKSSPEMWTPIFEQNRTHVVEALEAYIEHLREFHKTLVTGNFDRTKELMTEANQIRHVLDRITSKGNVQT